MKRPNAHSQNKFQWRWAYGIAMALMLMIITSLFLLTGATRIILTTSLAVIFVASIIFIIYLSNWEDRYQKLQQSYNQEIDFSRQIMESVSHGLTISDEHGKFVYVNRAYAEMLGLDAKKIVGKSPFDFTCEQSQDTLMQAFERRQKLESNSYASMLLHSSGKRVKVLIMGTPRTHQGRIVGNVAAIIPLEDDLIIMKNGGNIPKDDQNNIRQHDKNSFDINKSTTNKDIKYLN